MATKLDVLIAEALEIESQIKSAKERLAEVRETIVGAMIARKEEQHETEDGHAATLYTQTIYSWIVEKLAKCLSREQFDELCPRVADAGKLRKLVESGAGPRSLAKCHTTSEKGPILLVTPKKVASEAAAE